MSNSTTNENALSGLIAAAGVILAISYPVLAISTGFRAVFQIGEGDPSNSPWLTLLGALLYSVATIGFARMPRSGDQQRTTRRRPWRRIAPQTAWKISVVVLIVETLLTLLIGTLSFTNPELIGRNVWQFFGRDYGYFPLVQPLLGILWLFHPQTRRAYGGDN